MRILVTGGSGVLGRAAVPRLREQGHEVVAPARDELDLFDAAAVRDAVRPAEAVFHLATRIPPQGRRKEPGVWAENDRLRAEASALLVDAALAAATEVYVQPSVVFVYPPGPANEATLVGDVPASLRSALAAEAEAARFADAGRRGIALRLGSLWGPGTGSDEADDDRSLWVEDAGTALVAALAAPSGLYNVVADGAAVSNELFKRASGWCPLR